MKKYITKKNLIILSAVLLLVLTILVIRKSNQPLTDGQIITRLASLTTIPDPNTDAPRILKIDTTTPQQPFFKDAKEGDVAVLFLIAQKAYIYSPSSNRIINQGPIDNTEQKPAKPIEKKIETSSSTAGTSSKNTN